MTTAISDPTYLGELSPDEIKLIADLRSGEQERVADALPYVGRVLQAVIDARKGTEQAENHTSIDKLDEEEMRLIRLVRGKRAEGVVDQIARMTNIPETEDDDLVPGRLGGNELSAEEELALYAIGKLALEGIWTREQMFTQEYGIILDAIKTAIREGIMSFSPNGKTDLVTLIRYSDPEILRRDVDEDYAKGRMP